MRTCNDFLAEVIADVRNRAPFALRVAVLYAAIYAVLACLVTGRW